MTVQVRLADGEYRIAGDRGEAVAGNAFLAHLAARAFSPATIRHVDAFVSSLRTHRDRAMALAMLLGGLCSAEVRGLKLADADTGRRRLRVIGNGGKERHVPADRAFFSELAACLRLERPHGLATPECFVVLPGPTTGEPVTAAGLRRGSGARCTPGPGRRSRRW